MGLMHKVNEHRPGSNMVVAHLKEFLDRSGGLMGVCICLRHSCIWYCACVTSGGRADGVLE